MACAATSSKLSHSFRCYGVEAQAQKSREMTWTGDSTAHTNAPVQAKIHNVRAFENRIWFWRYIYTIVRIMNPKIVLVIILPPALIHQNSR